MNTALHKDTHCLLPEKRSRIGIQKSHFYNDLLQTPVRYVSTHGSHICFYRLFRRLFRVLHQFAQHRLHHMLTVDFRDGMKIRDHLCDRIDWKCPCIQHIDIAVIQRFMLMSQFHSCMWKEICLMDVFEKTPDIFLMIAVCAEDHCCFRHIAKRFLIMKWMIHENVNIWDMKIIPYIMFFRFFLFILRCFRLFKRKIVSEVIKCHYCKFL